MGEKSENTKSKLFDATLQLVAEKGISATTVDEIVERAGVAKGTVYYHFAGKAELVEALIADRLEPLVGRFAAAAAAADDATARLQSLVRAELEWIRDNRSFAKLLITELWREDRVWRDTLVLLRREIIGYMHDAIAEGIRSQEFRNDLDPDFAASALFGMTVTTALDWLVFDPERPLEYVLGQIGSLARMAVRA